ncbi:MAG TPA: hypothetical protein VFP72_07285 [Kineosporiaceae bacterium]|nr:hypothetical protein [Kineosporiaceae bacterium]
MSAFHREISNRIAETQDGLARAQEAEDDYLVGVRLGELESLARVAAEHGVRVDGVADSLTRHGLATPGVGTPLAVDLQEAELAEQRRRTRAARGDC